MKETVQTAKNLNIQYLNCFKLMWVAELTEIVSYRGTSAKTDLYGTGERHADRPSGKVGGPESSKCGCEDSLAGMSELREQLCVHSATAKKHRTYFFFS